MELTVEKILKALPAVGAIGGMSMPYKMARRVMLITKWLRDECRRAAQRESELLKLHNGEFDHDSAKNRFVKAEDAQAFSKDLDELLKTAIECPFEMLDLSSVKNELSLSPIQLEALCSVAAFESGETI